VKDYAIEYDKNARVFVLVHPTTRKVEHTTPNAHIAAKIALEAGTKKSIVETYAEGLRRLRGSR